MDLYPREKFYIDPDRWAGHYGTRRTISRPCSIFRVLWVSAVWGVVSSLEVKHKCSHTACSSSGYSIVFPVVDKISWVGRTQYFTGNLFWICRCYVYTIQHLPLSANPISGVSLLSLSGNGQEILCQGILFSHASRYSCFEGPRPSLRLGSRPSQLLKESTTEMWQS